MSFIHESLFWWSLPLISVPLIIHLINMRRHRRVKWAAMEFLLQSQKRHRTWIILKQLLLLLLRTLAVAAIVMMIAKPQISSSLGAMLGGMKTHLIVLLDDSYSMSDQLSGPNAFEEGKQVVTRLSEQLANRDSAKSMTLLRFSHVAQGKEPDLLDVTIDGEFKAKLETKITPMKASQTAAGPAEAVAAMDHLPGNPESENRLVYIVSDFRSAQWNEPIELQKALSKLDQAGVQLNLVSCVDALHNNLAITSLRPGPGTRAAGVPLMFEVTVRNYGITPVKEVSVQLEEDGVARSSVTIEELSPGKSATRRFPVLFQTAGEHAVSARLPSDPVDADNVRFSVVDFPATVPVLVIDGAPKGTDAFYLTSALSPGGKINSGLKPQVESPRVLKKGELSKFQSIFLLNIERLDPTEIEALEDYAKSGGGVAFFSGELSRSEFINKSLYRDGDGIFPLPLGPPTELFVDRLDKAPDFEVTDHPMFAVFAGERNSFISSVMIQRYVTSAKNWSPDPDSTTKVIAKLRNGAPLAVEKSFGDGRVVAILTKAGPEETLVGSWNNWGRNNPSYVVAMLELQAYLASGKRQDASRLIGTPLQVDFLADQFKPQVRFTLPGETIGGLSIDASPVKNFPQRWAATLAATNVSGVYDANLTALADGALSVRRWAYNVDPAEGDLKLLDGQQLANRLSGVNFQYFSAKSLTYNSAERAGFNLGQGLLYALVIVLLAEQVLAYFTSYHPKPIGGARS